MEAVSGFVWVVLGVGLLLSQGQACTSPSSIPSGSTWESAPGCSGTKNNQTYNCHCWQVYSFSSSPQYMKCNIMANRVLLSLSKFQFNITKYHTGILHVIFQGTLWFHLHSNKLNDRDQLHNSETSNDMQPFLCQWTHAPPFRSHL